MIKECDRKLNEMQFSQVVQVLQVLPLSLSKGLGEKYKALIVPHFLWIHGWVFCTVRSVFTD